MPNVPIGSLTPGMEYWVDQYWNINNTVRNDIPNHFVGKFIKLIYIVGKSRENPHSGLILMLEPSRTNVIFQDANGYEYQVSSLNNFYQRYRPSLIDIRNKNNIRDLCVHFPDELRRIISSFCGGSKVVKHIRGRPMTTPTNNK